MLMMGFRNIVGDVWIGFGFKNIKLMGYGGIENCGWFVIAYTSGG